MAQPVQRRLVRQRLRPLVRLEDDISARANEMLNAQQRFGVAPCRAVATSPMGISGYLAAVAIGQQLSTDLGNSWKQLIQ